MSFSGTDDGTVEVPGHDIILHWRNISKLVTVRPTATCTWCTLELPTKSLRKQLLFNCCGELRQGTITGLMGLSGSGKSTLLNTLACREVDAPDTFSGQIHLNGRRLTSLQRKQVRYVPQADIYWSQLTIHEHLMYIAQLRVRSPQPRDDAQGSTRDTTQLEGAAQAFRAACVSSVLAQLALEHCADTIILHLSGGEKKRVSVATELLDHCSILVREPKVLLLDEATSGLDSYSSCVLMAALTALVAPTPETGAYGNAGSVESETNEAASVQKWCVAMSIHQPSIPLFYSFDSIIFLSHGHVAYAGPPTALLAYLNNLGYYSAYYNTQNAFNNPAEYLLNLLYCSEQYDYSVPDLVQTVGEGDTGSQTPPECSDASPKDQPEPEKVIMRPRDHLVHVWNQRLPRGSAWGCEEDIELCCLHASANANGVGTPTREQTFGMGGAAGSRHSSRSVGRDGCGDRTSLRSLRLGGLSGHSYQALAVSKYARSFPDQFAILTGRVGQIMRPVYLNWRMFTQTVVIAVIAGLCWQEVAFVESKLFDLAGLSFFTLSYWFFDAVFHGVTELQIDRLLVCKERAAGSYHISAYFLARLSATLGFKLLYPALYFVVVYAMTGAGASTASATATIKFFSLLSILLLSAITADSIGLLIGCLVTGLDEALSLVTIVAICMLLFGGFYIQNLPSYISWLSIFSPFRYAYNAWMLIELSATEVTCDGGHLLAVCASGLGVTVVPTAVLLGVLGVTGSLGFNIGCLVGYCFVSLIASYLALRFRKVSTLFVF